MTDTNSILLSTKKLLGLTEDYTEFDTDIIIHINTVLSNLIQMGVGPQDGFTVTGESETWSSFTSNDSLIQQVKSYVYLSVRLLFDPPTNSFVIDSINRQRAELEWRLYVQKGGY